MKTTLVTGAVALLLLGVSTAAPVADWSAGKGWQNGKGQGGWKGHNGQDIDDEGAFPFNFTSTYHVVATPDQVVNGTTLTGGLAGAIGYYDFGINSDLDYICFNIKLVGFRGNYQSPAKTATHMHEAAKGASGPPRLAFPNPVAVGDGTVRYSRGCLSAPYTTGVNTTAGLDTGAGFSVKQIEAAPASFFADVHSSLAVPGAVRGQLA